MVKAAISCGELLAEKKHTVGHGRWLRWVRENLDFSLETAQIYIKLNQYKERIYEVEPKSLRMALVLIKKGRITPGMLSGDAQILYRNIVSPIKIVRRRLRKLPRDSIHYDDVVNTMEKLMEAIHDLLADLQ